MSQPSPIPDRTLDTRGSYCPQPVIDTDSAMRELADGEVLEILADDAGVLYDLPAWCSAHRQKLIGIERDATLIRVLIQKSSE